MDARAPRTSVASLVSLFGYLRRLGVSPEDVAEAGLVALAAEAAPDARMPAQSFIDLLERCAERLDDPLFGLRYGQSIDPPSLGPPGLFWRDAPTFRYSLGVTSRFLHLHYEGVAVSLAVDGATAQIAQRLDVGLRRNARQSVESNISFGLSAGRWILGDGWDPLRVTFSHPPACDPSLYAEVLRAPVSFGASEDALIVRTADLDRPAADRNLLRLHAAERVLLTRALGEPLALSRQVERVVDDLLRLKTPRLDAAARALGMSARSLQRHLQRGGTSFQALLGERRLRMIERERLGRPDATLAALADRTALSDATAVSRFLRHQREAPARSGTGGRS